jgi:hypothetical protein
LPRNRIAALIVLLTLLLPARSPAASSRTDDSDGAGRKRVLTRSLLFPGLGQLGEKKYLKAFLLAGAEIACLAGAYHNNRLGNKYYWLYRQAVGADDAVRNRGLTERYDRRRNDLLLAAAGVWAVNLVDALLLANRRYKRHTLNAAIRYSHDTHALGLDLDFAL